MKIIFDIDNFINYILSIYPDNSFVSEDTLRFDKMVRSQDIQINHDGFSSEKINIKGSKTDKLERVSQQLSVKDATTSRPKNIKDFINCLVPKNELDENRRKKLHRNLSIWMKLLRHYPQLSSEIRTPKILEEKIRFSHSIAFLNKDNYIDSKYSDLGINIGKLGQEIPFLKKIFYVDKEKSTSLTYYTPQLKNWGIMDDCLPLSEIIIVDPYLFKTSQNQLKKNIDIIVDSLIITSSDVNIIILTEFDHTNDDKYYIPNFLNALQYPQKIKDNYCKKGKHINLTILWLDKYEKNKTDDKKKNGIKMHDRYILTNHRLHISGHSFSQYFDKDDKKQENGGRFLISNSFCKQETEKVSISLIQNINQLIQNVDKKNCLFVSGYKKSQFFDFSKLDDEKSTSLIDNLPSFGKEIKALIKNGFIAAVEKDEDGNCFCGSFRLAGKTDKTKVKLMEFNFNKDYDNKSDKIAIKTCRYFSKFK